VVVQGGLVRRFSVVACAASLAIMRALTRRLQNRLIHLFLIQLLLFPNVVVVYLRIVVVRWWKVFGSLICSARL
jgi:hypothetical protein